MKEITVESLDAIVRFAQDGLAAVAYRGVDDIAHHLIPRVTRLGITARAERDTMELFRMRGQSAVDGPPPSSELEWLALGQHHGLATRLMDWTQSILVAAFFAVDEIAVAKPQPSPKTDAAIYAMAAPFAFAPFSRLP